MDISRIEAYNPNRIDWKRLTAKEIMQYRNRGVEVPDVYLQWAHDFLNTVEAERNDDVTYEIAEAQARNQNDENAQELNGELVPTDGSSIGGSESDDNPKNNTDNTTAQVSIEQTQVQNNNQTSKADNKPLSASELREKMKKDGVNSVSVASVLKGYSEINSELSRTAVDTSNNIQNSSANTIEELEHDMQDLMAKIDEAQNGIRAIAPKSDNESAIARINQLQAEINAYGESGISELTDSAATFNEYDATLTLQEGIGETSNKYSSETIIAGEEILNNIVYQAFGRNVISAGTNAISAGDNAIGAQNNASGTNKNSQSRLNSLEADIQSKTGLKIENKSTEDEISNDTEITADKNNTETEKESETDKTIKAAQNDGTDNTDKINTDIDEIIKRKIRRGENIG